MLPRRPTGASSCLEDWKNRGRHRKGVHYQKMIQKVLKKYIGFCLAAALAAFVLPICAQAADRSCVVSIPVEVEETADFAADESFTIVLEAVGEDVPMPEQKEIIVKVGEKAEFGPITYTIPEDYQYRVYQKTGNNKNFTYDKSIYIVTVRVVNDGMGGLAAEIWAIQDGSQNKTDKISFENIWTQPAVKTQVKTGDSTNPGVLAAIALCAAAVAAVSWAARRKKL